MGKKDERKFENLHKLTYLLLNHPQGLTKSAIARRLRVHRSTAAEYIVSLNGIDAPVYEISPNHFTIDRDTFKVQISVDMHESLAIHLASRLLTTQTDKHNPHAASALRKLSSALEKLAPLISKHMKVSANLLDGEGRRNDPVFMQALEVLTQAWSQRKKVKLTHESKSGKIYKYIFSPYFIEPYATGRAVHVIGLREPINKIRTFKIERIRTIKILDKQTYTIPAEFNPHEQLKDAWGIWYTDKEPVLVKLKFSHDVAKRVAETTWHHTQEIKTLEDGSLIWTAKVAEWKEMLYWIRGWGSECFVESPKELQETLMGEAKAMAEKYGWTVSSQSSGASSTLDDFYGD